MLKLNTSIEQIPRIQKNYRKYLGKLGIKTVRDLLFHVPHRYDDFSNVQPISKAELGEVITVQGKILDIQNIRTWKKRMNLTEAIVEDKTGAIKVVWFNQPYLVGNLKKGETLSLSGKVSFAQDSIFLSNPAYEVVRSSDQKLTHTAGLVAVYPETAGITSRWLRYIIKTLLPKVEKAEDVLPQEIKKSQRLIGLEEALHKIHFPKTKEDIKKAQRRLEFEELFLLQLLVGRERLKIKKTKSTSIPPDIKLVKKFVSSLPYKLTNAQRKAAWEILQDLNKESPMNRLLEGDVGSGKTVVAAIAALNVSRGGWQAAFMAPTEILAEQHFNEISKLLSGFRINIGLLTGSRKRIMNYELRIKDIKRNDLLNAIEKKEIDVLIGTHALIQEGVKFNELALVIVDEQHRFGVEQRAKLAKDNLKSVPHLLSMTATPIPRTLALTIYGDLDISLLNEMPKGRQKIITKVVAPTDRKKAYQFVKDQISKERQAFVICPLIEESEKLEVAAATKEYEKLAQKIFPDLKLGLLHGRLKPKEKETIMRLFKDRKIDVLVSTSVVEVGIDVPNATVMMIEGADRFGLSQLHQFRGRVGRGKHQSYCFLFTDSNAKKTHARLRAIIKCENGFELAEKDLEIRGPGDFYGVRQSGLPDIGMKSLTDINLVKETRSEATKLLEKDPELAAYPLLQKKLDEFQHSIHLE